MNDRLRHQQEDRNNFQQGLEAEYGTVGHPKAEKLFQIAWDYGHSSGKHEVKMYYEELSELLE